jgi:hypothetical protein
VNKTIAKKLTRHMSRIGWRGRVVERSHKVYAVTYSYNTHDVFTILSPQGDIPESMKDSLRLMKWY